MLRHLYNLPYELPEGQDPAVHHARMYIAGEFYGIPSLKSNATTLITPLLVSIEPLDAKKYLNVAEEVYGQVLKIDDGTRSSLALCFLGRC